MTNRPTKRRPRPDASHAPQPAALAQLLLGQGVFAFSVALFLQAGLGCLPWDVLHQGLHRHLPGLTYGQVTMIVGATVLATWIPLGEKPGIGTAASVLLMGSAVDIALGIVAPPQTLPARWAMLASAIVLSALGTACYVGARLGRGPGDGVMVGLHARTGLPLRRIRLALEVGVTLLGVALGGRVGPATLAYAIVIGPAFQALLPWFDRDRRTAAAHAVPTALRN